LNTRLRLRLMIVTLAAASLGLLLSSAGSAGRPGSWTPVTSRTLRNIDQVGLARTGNGLQVVWLGKHGQHEDLLTATISPGGTVGHASPVVANWASLANPSVVATSSGLAAFWGGLRTSSTSDPYSSGTVFTATRAGAGGWTLGPGPVAGPSNAYASDLVASTLEKEGTPVTAWSGTGGFYIHKGLDPAISNVKVQSACCAYQPTLATDQGSGEVYAAWYSNAAGGYGIHVRRVLPTPGQDHVLPGSASADRKSAVSPVEAVGIVGREHTGGVCAAYGVGYPSWKALNVWCTQRGAPLRVWTGDVTHFTVASALDGRVWALWSTRDAIYAVRSNKSVTQFGAAVSVGVPPGTTDIWNLAGDATAAPTAPLDLLASVTKGGIGVWHTQVEPGLTVTTTVNAGSRVIKVLDAGDPVHGASVRISGPHPSALSAPAGAATATGLTGGRYTVTASAAGYTSAQATFVIHA
jgi:hypothetical protein